RAVLPDSLIADRSVEIEGFHAETQSTAESAEKARTTRIPSRDHGESRDRSRSMYGCSRDDNREGGISRVRGGSGTVFAGIRPRILGRIRILRNRERVCRHYL